MKKLLLRVCLFVLMFRPFYSWAVEENAMIDIGNVSYEIPVGKNVDAVLRWCEAGQISIHNFSERMLEEMIRKELKRKVEGISKLTYDEDVANAREELSKYTIPQIKELLLNYQNGKIVPFNFVSLQEQVLLNEIDFWEKSQTFFYQNDKYYWKETFQCDSSKLYLENYKEDICGRPDLKSQQIMVYPSVKTLPAFKNFRNIYLSLYEDDDNQYKVYSGLIRGTAYSKKVLVSLISDLYSKYGIPKVYNQVKQKSIPIKTRMLMPFGSTEPSSTVYIWGPNLALFCSSEKDDQGEWIEDAIDYSLFYADPVMGQKFYDNYLLVNERVKNEEKKEKGPEKERLMRVLLMY